MNSTVSAPARQPARGEPEGGVGRARSLDPMVLGSKNETLTRRITPVTQS